MAQPFVLVHSPLVGPFTWRLVARELEAAGQIAIVPELRSPERIQGSYHVLHVESVRAAVEASAASGPFVLVAHSGAGPLLPAIGVALGHEVERSVFVDAGLPAPGRSRLDAFGDQAAAEAFRTNAREGLVMPWPDAVLRTVILDDEVRASFAADVPRMPLAVYEEPLPAIPGWPDAPCGYLRFSDSYLAPFAEAMRLGWPTRQFAAGHFHMLEDPKGVARALVELTAG
jgi:Alpha/beta hydrolase family